jgi:hypothetical protein
MEAKATLFLLLCWQTARLAPRGLQLGSYIGHLSSQLILLSRIDGDAPRAKKTIRAGVLDSSRAG